MILGSLTLFSFHKQRRDDLHNQLFDLLGDRLNIRSYVYDQMEPGANYTDDLVVITTPFFKERVISCLHPDTPYIVAKRTVRMDKLSCLFEVPVGSQVLVTYNLYDGAMDLAKDLREMGFTHFYMHGYDSNKPLEREYQYAITLGDPQLVPPGIPHILDLGMRDLSLSTVSQILSFFTGNNQIDELIMNRYIKKIIDNMRHLDQEIRKNARMKRHLQLLLDEFADGMIYFDGSLNIMEYNQVARSYLGDDIHRDILRALLPANWDQTPAFDYYRSIEGSACQISLRLLQDIDQGLWMMTIKALPKEPAPTAVQEHPATRTEAGRKSGSHFTNLVYCSEAMSQVIARAERMACSETAVLIRGESGTGKELLARGIHNCSPRAAGPFLPVNCGALTESLLESELFGYEEGAFTGARKRGKQGLFELAGGGTLFLDEIGDASLVVQQRLLRVLQEKEVYRISGERPIPVDVRIITATHQDLPALIRAGKFRQDLYYRINVLPITLPPLRQRREDIILLFYYYLNINLNRYQLSAPEISSAASAGLEHYAWPGNVRELRSLVEYLVNGVAFGSAFSVNEEILAWLENSRDESEKVPLLNNSHPPNDTNRKPADGINLKIETAAVLRALESLQLDGRPPGHQELLDFCRDQGVILTKWQLKYRLNRLKELNLIQSQKGFGSLVTPTGKAKLMVN